MLLSQAMRKGAEQAPRAPVAPSEGVRRTCTAPVHRAFRIRHTTFPEAGPLVADAPSRSVFVAAGKLWRLGCTQTAGLLWLS